jgi:hypothetical protein
MRLGLTVMGNSPKITHDTFGYILSGCIRLWSPGEIESTIIDITDNVLSNAVSAWSIPARSFILLSQ